MKLPKTLVIAGQTWRIRTGKRIDKLLELENYVGRSLFATNEMYIAVGKRSQSNIEETLLHEVIHVVLANAGLLKSVLKDRDVEESVTEALSCGLYAFFKDNKFEV